MQLLLHQTGFAPFGSCAAKNNFWEYSALRILIKAQNENERIQKIIKRDNITLQYAELRDKAGIEYNEKDFDLVLTNTYENEQLTANLQKIIEYINKKIT